MKLFKLSCSLCGKEVKFSLKAAFASSICDDCESALFVNSLIKEAFGDSNKISIIGLESVPKEAVSSVLEDIKQKIKSEGIEEGSIIVHRDSNFPANPEDKDSLPLFIGNKLEQIFKDENAKMPSIKEFKEMLHFDEMRKAHTSGMRAFIYILHKLIHLGVPEVEIEFLLRKLVEFEYVLAEEYIYQDLFKDPNFKANWSKETLFKFRKKMALNCEADASDVNFEGGQEEE